MIPPSGAINLLRIALDNANATFRPDQWQAITRLVYDKAQLLVVQRTGWGKSLVYFIATRLLRHQGAGPTLLVSPLLALMRNQVLSAHRLQVRAEAIHSANRSDWHSIIKRIKQDQVDILLISPERLASQSFREEILYQIAARVGLFVVDEVHCISDWGHDFRPDYRRIARILRALPVNIPVLATTATANNRVVADIRQQLGYSLEILRGPLARHSLRLQNISLPEPSARMAWLAQILPKIPGCGIIYTLTVSDAQRLTSWLQMNGIDAAAYWGGLSNNHRITLEQQLLHNQIKVVIATNALSMGFDKPDMGFVIHYQRPASVVHYYQQVGRAGRATQRAYGILLSGKEDDHIADYFFQQAFPPPEHTHKVLQTLSNFSEGLNSQGATIHQLATKSNLSSGQIKKVLKLLVVENPSPVLKQGSRWLATPVLYQMDTQKIAHIQQIRQNEQQQMRVYATTKTCLMVFLSRALDDPNQQPCGLCAPCHGKPFVSSVYSHQLASQASQFLRQQFHPIPPKKRWPATALPNYGFSGPILASQQMETGRALCIWNDGGWGEMVKEGKQADDDSFNNELVDALAGMIQNHWQPTPKPTWVCAVPSLNHPLRVAGFARRLAQHLNLTFVDCVKKVKQTPPQKLMNNPMTQASNLDGAFTIHQKCGFEQPLLLVDDVVDSGWTLTIIAALLRQAGSGPVFPVTLAKMLPKP